jgi:hypothetical protein
MACTNILTLGPPNPRPGTLGSGGRLIASTIIDTQVTSPAGSPNASGGLFKLYTAAPMLPPAPWKLVNSINNVSVPGGSTQTLSVSYKAGLHPIETPIGLYASFKYNYTDPSTGAPCSPTTTSFNSIFLVGA